MSERENMEVLISSFDEKKLDFKARVFKVLGDANRIKILEFLRDGEKCQCEIIPILGQSQPTVSRHLRLLEEVGLLTSRRDGNKALYQATDERIFDIPDVIDNELMGILSQRLMSRLIAL